MEFSPRDCPDLRSQKSAVSAKVGNERSNSTGSFFTPAPGPDHQVKEDQ